MITLLDLSIVNPRPDKAGWDWGAGADRILSVDCLGRIPSFCLEDTGWVLDGVVEVGATVRFDVVLAEAGRAGDTALPVVTMEDGRNEFGIASTLPRPLPSRSTLLASPPLTSTRAVSSIGFKEATDAEGLKCRFELLWSRAGCRGEAGGVGGALSVGLEDKVEG